MTVIEGWLVITPKKHVYFYSEHGDCDQRVLELPWNHLEDQNLLLSFIEKFSCHMEDLENGGLSLPVQDITEIKLKAPLDILTTWFAENFSSEQIAFASTVPLLPPKSLA